MEVKPVAAELEAIDGIEDVHDLHLWPVTSGMHVATAHLVVRVIIAVQAASDRDGAAPAAPDRAAWGGRPSSPECRCANRPMPARRRVEGSARQEGPAHRVGGWRCVDNPHGAGFTGLSCVVEVRLRTHRQRRYEAHMTAA